MTTLSNTTPPKGMHALLRASTGAAHARLEDTLALLQPPLERGRYACVLAGFHGFHQAWEPALAAALHDAPFCAPRQRLQLLQHDLLALGLPLPALQQLPACDAAAALCDSPDAALGSLYVMEGSTLGGRLIARQLALTPWCPAGGLRYFTAHGAASGARWHETLALIEARTQRPQQVADSAVRTFDLLQRWMAAPPALQLTPPPPLGQAA